MHKLDYIRHLNFLSGFEAIRIFLWKEHRKKIWERQVQINGMHIYLLPADRVLDYFDTPCRTIGHLADYGGLRNFLFLKIGNQLIGFFPGDGQEQSA